MMMTIDDDDDDADDDDDDVDHWRIQELKLGGAHP